jgi:hypothetical protein
MNGRLLIRSILFSAWVIGCLSCERDFNIALKKGPEQLVVEAYINNELPLYNYVILTHGQEYFDTSFTNIPVAGAIVTITEGIMLGDGSYQWDASTRKHLTEAESPQVPGGRIPGLYMDTTVFNNPAQALNGRVGKHYLLEIETKGNRYTATTFLPPPVELDSVTSGHHFMDSIYEKARLTIYFKDPDTIGNTQLYYWRINYHHGNSFGWGAFGNNRYLPGTDDLVNGEYLQLTPNNGFPVGDTVHFHLVSVERKVYNFWDSYNKARDNSGPFATPVKLASTVEGSNVVGCFSGFSLSTKSILVK